MKLRYILVFLICSNTYAANLTLDRTRSVYKIEYNRETDKVKIISKTTTNAKCEFYVKDMTMIKKAVASRDKAYSRKDKKVKLTLVCS